MSLETIVSDAVYEKQTFIALARASFEPSRRAPCKVCGKYASLTQAHHLVPLAVQFGRGYIQPDQRHVWLCPTHHVALHILISQALGKRLSATRTVANVIYDVAEDDRAQLQTLLELLDEAKE